MCSPSEGTPEYKSLADILYWHGLFILVFYCLLRLTEWLTPTRIWSKMAKMTALRPWAWDDTHQKSKAFWQDIGVILHVVFVSILLFLDAHTPAGTWWINVIAVWLLVDILCFHLRVLWFDDLAIMEPVHKRMVWSHRRIFIQAVFNFGESICLFSLFYHAWHPMQPIYTILRYSFTTATSLSSPEALSCATPFIIIALQIIVSVFFLVVAMGTIASIGYARPELGRTFDQ